MMSFSKEIKIWLLILASFLAALALMLLRLPNWVEWIYPEWLVVVVLYWVFAMPYRVNVGVAWLVGFLLDILYNIPVGENALALVVAAYFTATFSRKISLLDFWKKAAVIFGLIVWCQLLPLLLSACLSKHISFWPIFSRAVMSTLVWLIIALLFNYKRRSYFESYY
ncbi:Rod shape-determining protein MreD [Gammaproteobacteria bacterium]